MVAPSLMSVKRIRPRHTTVLPRRRVAGTREIATQSRDLDQIARQGSGMGGGRIVVGKKIIEELHFDIGYCEIRFSVRL